LLVLSYVKPFKPTKEFCYMFSAGSTRLFCTPWPGSVDGLGLTQLTAFIYYNY